MLKKTLLVTAALSFLALGATAPASSHDRGDRWNGPNNWNNYNDDDYRYIQKPHHKQYAYWRYPPYPWWLQYYSQPRWY